MLLQWLEQMANRPRLNPVEARAVPSYLLLVAAWVLVIAGFSLTSFTYNGTLNTYYVTIVVCLLGSMGLRYLSLARVAGCVEAFTLKLGISAASALGSAMLAATALPLVDGQLVRWDQALGFDWIAWMNWLFNKPVLISLFYESYPTLFLQTLILFPALFLAKQDKRCWTFILAWALALACSMALFPVFPAVGPIVFHEFQLPGIPYKDDHMDVFVGARDGSVRALGIETIRGMVTFPSFHVAGAILLGWAAARLPYLRWPFIALNATMLVSAIPIGGHYLVDVLAGTVIAAGAIRLAKWIQDSRLVTDWRRAPQGSLASVPQS